ncbi:uncharacterized protein PHACADRAFT_259818 [Phanerochaete carnosa HHB-10118-sp]|uniref:Uncharacterized protein n=1 Tax=Phanerochaete carnosa (strain HHB-10118-sp) TaxID=650164 RepID=K5WSQ5_PHACS|nr:uncharacterized protein PHACADRAFT_259818 [Phanerochaete carnosa HHB-10118-sp]EKM53437.1 hypothetical protein PHACADRAFT_259818 [Phanerochaete carnosa HHB-10118-sp]
MFGLAGVSLLWSTASSRGAVDVADATLELSKNATALAQEVVSQGVPAAPNTYTPSALARLPVVGVALVGLWHIAFVCVHFSQLGYHLQPYRAQRALLARGRGCRHTSVASDEHHGGVSAFTLSTFPLSLMRARPDFVIIHSLIPASSQVTLVPDFIVHQGVRIHLMNQYGLQLRYVCCLRETFAFRTYRV